MCDVSNLRWIEKYYFQCGECAGLWVFENRRDDKRFRKSDGDIKRGKLYCGQFAAEPKEPKALPVMAAG